MDQKELQVGIIGAGGITQAAHIPSFQKIPGVTVTAISDPNTEKMKTVAKQFNLPQTFSDYRQMLKNDALDIISIGSPNYLHKEHSVAALEAGKDVICEKPVALNVRETDEILECSARTGKKFMVAFTSRFKASSVFLKQLIDAGELGDVYYAKASYLRRRGIPGLGGWFTTKKLSGGGPLIDCGVHILDKVYWLLGAPKPVSVSGVTYQKFKEVATDGGWPPPDTRKGDHFSGTFDVEDLAAAFIRFANGTTLFLESCWAGNTEASGITFHLWGTRAGAREDTGVKIFGEKDGILTDTVPELPAGNGFEEEFRHFVACVRENKPPITTPREIRGVIQIIEGIYKSAETGREYRIGE